MSKSGNHKKSRRGSPSSVRDSAPVTQANQDALLALKTVLSVPVPVEKDQRASNDAVMALKAVLSVPVKVANPAPAPADRPKADAVQALKSLLMSPVNRPEETKQPAPASFEALKTMLLSSKKEEVVEESVPVGQGKKKRSSSPKTSAEPKEAKATPTRSDKKKKKAGAPAPAGRSPFAGSLFQSSPDPMAMPMPDFDEAQSGFFADSFEDEEVVSVPPQDQLSSLRMMLKIPA